MIYDLLKPEDDKHSQALAHCIREAIEKEQGCISFAMFMELALYHPEWGYYSSPDFELGKQGDFTTAPELSPLFADCLTLPIAHIMTTIGAGDVLELGAGTGKLALDLLTALKKQGRLPARYFIYEISPELRKKQQQFLQTHCKEFFSSIQWIEVLPSGFKGTIIANEVLDALPVHCFRIEDQEVCERGVGWENQQFVWKKRPTPSPIFIEYVNRIREHYSLRNGYESEINLHVPTLIDALTTTLEQGLVLLIDYGYGQREYYHPERRKGTLACFYQHQQSDDPLRYPGLQDITAHVDFTRIAQTATDAGCALRGFTSQSSFLLACGLLERAAEAEKQLSAAEIVNLHHAIKILTLPTEMGERIKVMALSKNMETASTLPGFSLHDRRRDL